MILRPAFAALSLISSSCLAQGEAAADADSPLPVVRIKAKTQDEALPVAKSLTVLNAERIERQQSDNIFDILKDVPGVGVAGGPRSSGMRFTLRGFTDNEDVLFKIDGAVKGFEKYRFGGGVFLEPELLKALSVERGPSVTSGSGALGGTISATTKSAADLLRPGQRVGALTKVGYNENNGERLRMLSVYGRPNDQIDLMTAIVKRDSGDIRLPDGSRLARSETHAESRLVKLGFLPIEHLLIELGHTQYLSGPESTPYDATGGLAGVGGVVQRAVDDATTNLRLLYEPSEALTVRGLLAREKTHLHDHHLRGESRICAVGPITYCDDYWQYDILTGELFADLKWRAGPVDAVLTVGAQAIRNERQVQRISSNAAINAINWPNGFNADQPPGDKHSEALIVDSSWTWGDWTLTPGARWDHYTVIARGGTRDNMLREGQAPDISFSKLQPSIGLTWRVPGSDFALTGRYNEAFRPPLIDQYFRDGSGNSAGQSGLCMRSYGDQNSPGKFVIPSTIQPLYDPAGLGKPYNPALDHAPLSGICGDLYQPQISVNKELTVAWSPSATAFGQWYARLTHFRIHTTQTLGSLRWVAGQVTQPGVEDRRGTELELRFGARSWFGDLNASTVRRTSRNESAVTPTSADAYSIPPDTASMGLGLRAFEGRLEAGGRLRRLSDRQVDASGATGAPAICVGGFNGNGEATHKGATLVDLFASWKFNEMALLRASIDNVDNRDYCLSSSFSGAIGFHAPGRAAKLALTLQF